MALLGPTWWVEVIAALAWSVLLVLRFSRVGALLIDDSVRKRARGLI